MSATIKTYTLGCKVNQYETELVKEGLLTHGYQEATEDQLADLCVVNTCTVTNEGDAKSRQVIRKLARENPDSRIIVMGCYATRDPDRVAQLPQVAEVVTDKRELGDVLGRFGVIDLPRGISQFGNRHRAYVKVQDGCLLRCSYCIIPHVRPEPTSRPLADIVEEFRRLADNGYGEVVLTGIHLGHYGVEQNHRKPKSQWIRLAHLVESLAKTDVACRIRLSSIEATEITRELLQVMADHQDRICPHFHVCLQSGSDRILRRMRRRWGAKRFVDRCRLIRETLDQPALTTDVIVGFPGESDEDFAATCEVSRQAGFSKIHIFPFSARRGTPAAEYEQQIPKATKQARCRQLAELEVELRAQYFEQLVGRELEVMVEGSEGNRVLGTSCRYAPVSIEAEHPESLPPGSLVPVQIACRDGERLIGRTPGMNRN